MSTHSLSVVGTNVVQPARYRARLADSQADVRAAQFLRFMVFNVELQEGLEASYHTCLDADRFDAVCDHLLVEDTATGEIVGTYRLQTGASAARNHGYYSEQEFSFGPYEGLRHRMVELGRACIHSAHRNFAVLNLLWKGIAQYAASHGATHLVGCSSLTSQDPAVGMAAFARLRDHLVAEPLRTVPQPMYRCLAVDAAVEVPKIPKLLSAYLMVGAKICGAPALDREFRTIDFLTLMDLGQMNPRALQRFFGAA